MRTPPARRGFRFCGASTASLLPRQEALRDLRGLAAHGELPAVDDERDHRPGRGSPNSSKIACKRECFGFGATATLERSLGVIPIEASIPWSRDSAASVAFSDSA
jgi:hypothetical protein